MIIHEQKITRKCFTAELVEDNILYLYFFQDSFSTEKDYREAHDIYNSLRNNKPIYVIIEHGENASIDASARNYLQDNKFDALGSATVMHSLAQRIIYNLYLKFRNQSFPAKGFRNYTKAFNWIKSLS